jgi:hypothetical protein
VTLTGHSYGNGTYVASSSTVYPPQPNFTQAWRAFDHDYGSWFASAETYNATTGTYTGSVKTTVSGATFIGEWLQIQLPTSVVLHFYQIAGQANGTYANSPNMPSSWVVVGSNDGTTWALVDRRVNYTLPVVSRALATLTLPEGSSAVAYRYYRIIVKALSWNSSLGINEWILFGSESLRYPPAAMTAATTAFSSGAVSYGVGSYTVTSSTVFGDNFRPFYAFNYNDADINNGWACAANRYLNGSGSYLGSATTAGYAGEYIQLELPTAITMMSYTIVPSSNDVRCSPRAWRWFGSADGVGGWTQLDDRTGETAWTAGVQRNFTPTVTSTTPSFRFFRMVVNQVTNVDIVWILELKIFGV